MYSLFATTFNKLHEASGLRRDCHDNLPQRQPIRELPVNDSRISGGWSAGSLPAILSVSN
jgi:hypothetical protein